MTERTWRFDSVRASDSSSDEGASADPLTGGISGCQDAVTEPAQRNATFRLVRKWHSAAQRWIYERLKRFDRHAVSFEDILHEFSAIIETTDSPLIVQAGVLRQARRLVPGYRIELITGAPPSQDDRTLLNIERDGGDSDRGELPPASRGEWLGQLLLEVPLRCGSLVRGRLRIRSRGAGVGSLRAETVRRLNTLCTIGASALDRLYLQAEWPWDDDVAHVRKLPGADSDHESGANEGMVPQAALLHDATFLNAVLPFALNQAQRHMEPLSIVCVSIDRLRGIQDLLGRGTVDRLVRNVGETVASLIRGSDIVVRLDDDRVVAVLPRAPGKGALEVATRVCAAVADNSRGDDSIPSVTVSIGVATFPSCADNVLSLFSAADDALERARSHGRNQAALAPPRSTLGCSVSRAVSTPVS